MFGRIYPTLIIVLALTFFACNPPSEEMVYDYSLLDINEFSSTYGENIGPGYFENQVTVHYFGHQGWDLCQIRVGNLDSLYEDLLNNGINNVRIIAIGKSSESSDNDEWINGHSIPITIDSYPYNTWTNWGAEQRDLFFLDTTGNYVTNFNISSWDYNKVYNHIINLLP